jgi:hypothetical protein
MPAKKLTQAGKHNQSINIDIKDGDNKISINERDKNRKKHDNQMDIDNLKKITNILFVDDDPNYMIVKILKKQGWINTKIVTDIIDPDKFNDVHVFFVDINGVGKKMHLKDEGMGLALLLKDKFVDKKVILYSSDTNRDMAHPVFKKIDGILPADAQIYQFTNILEQFAKEIKI